jgi:hypothetical protein
VATVVAVATVIAVATVAAVGMAAVVDGDSGRPKPQANRLTNKISAMIVRPGYTKKFSNIKMPSLQSNFTASLLLYH